MFKFWTLLGCRCQRFIRRIWSREDVSCSGPSYPHSSARGITEAVEVRLTHINILTLFPFWGSLILGVCYTVKATIKDTAYIFSMPDTPQSKHTTHGIIEVRIQHFCIRRNWNLHRSETTLKRVSGFNVVPGRCMGVQYCGYMTAYICPLQLGYYSQI